MEFKKLIIDTLIPADYNPRKKLKPGDSEFEKIKNSINEFGYVDPVIVNKDMTVIGGHQRISVLKTLGFKEAIFKNKPSNVLPAKKTTDR